MNKGKWALNRIFAFVLALMMLLTVPEVAAAAVIDAEAEAAVVESTETNEKGEEATEKDGEIDISSNVNVSAGANKEISTTRITFNMADNAMLLGETLTSAAGMSFFSNEAYVNLKTGNYVKWIDRIDVPEYGYTLYDTLVEAVDNDGTNDYLIDDTYFSSTGANYVDGYNVIEVCEIAYTDEFTQDDFNDAAAVIRTVYDAFDRDFPEVFWLTGDVAYSYGGYVDNSTGITYITYYLITKGTVDGEAFDIRAIDYQSANAIETAISSRDTAINTILSGTTATDKVELIKYFNTWLTEHNAYCTVEVSNVSDYPALSYECLSALKGSTGDSGPVCEAYARAFKILCDKKEIPCVLVDGIANNGVSSEAHMWNYVQVNGVWYAVDVTWNDPYVESGVAVSGSENEGWLLLGSNTSVGGGYTFIQTHPVSNQASVNGVCFTNGPVLSEKAYELSDIKSATISYTETTYGYGVIGGVDTTPTVNITLEDGCSMSDITYQWGVYAEDPETGEIGIYKIEGATSNKLPAGLDIGIYYVLISYKDEPILESDVFVFPKELTPTISGTTSKTYDGTTEYTDDGLSIKFEGVVDGDVISATADFAYKDANAGTNKTITATNIELDGDKAYNYKLTATTATANVGTIEAKDISGATVTLDENKLTYNGKEQTVTPTVVVGGKALVAGTDYTVSGNAAKDVKDSAYTVTITAKGNYSGTATATYTISYLDADIAVKYNNSTTVKDWYSGTVMITADGYTISDSLNGTYSVSYLVEAEGTTAGVELYFKNEDGYITDAKAIGTIRIDKNAPADLGITVKDDVFRTFLNTITFGIFHIETQTGTISATENVSGLEGYYYYIDKSGSTTVKTSSELDQLTFTKGNNFSLAEDGNYVIYAYAVDNAGNKTGYVCTNGIVIDTTEPVIEVVQPTADNGNLKDTSATIVFTASEAGTYHLLSGTDPNASYTPEQIIAANSSAMVEGTNEFSHGPYEPNTYHVLYIVVKDTAGNLSDEVTKIEFTTQKTLPTITTVPTVSGTYGDTVSEMTIVGGVASVNGTPIEGTWSVTTDVTDVPEVGTTKEYTVKFTPSEAGKYGEVTTKVVPVVAKKVITVAIDSVEKSFGEENPELTFTVPNGALVGDDTKADLGITISTTAIKTSYVGTYAITGTANAKNYSVTFTNGTLTITKATATNPAPIAKEYVYGLGSEGKVYIPIGSLLPENNGGFILSSSKVDENNIIDTLANGESEISYVVKNTGSAGQTATITVVAEMNNYENATITINITLVDKLAVSLKNDVTTVGSLTYGDTLSKLTFGEVSFVDSDGNPVDGTLAWDTPNAKLNAGTHEVAWTFTPSNTGKYKVVTGTLSVEVAKATPNLSTPTVDAMVYDPDRTLADVTIKSEATTVPGTWSWVTPEANVLAGTREYEVVFTPNDTVNYKTVTKTVNVEVEKATPYVSVLPITNSIEYGNNISAAGLNGGIVVYAENDNRTVTGTWNWEDADIKPSTIGTHTYKAVFSPEDSSNYNSITVEIEVVVEKAEWPPVMPAGGKVPYWCETVGDVPLPENWVWAEEDVDTTLSTEVYTAGKAVYVGEDKDNYVKTERSINIIRDIQTAPHVEGDETAMGWDKIDDEIVNSDGEEVRVDMNGFSHIDTSVLETLKEENAVVIFVLDDGTEWVVKGEDVSDEEVGNYIDMNVELFDKDAADKPAIPDALVKDVVTGAKDHKFLSLAHNGEFGFKAALTINVGAANAGKLATLYYYNETSGKLEETENVKIEVAADGTIVLAFEHASDYVLVMNDKPTESGNGGATPAPGPGTGDGVFGNIYFYITLLLAGGLAGYVGVRKKREEQI